jgi:hypothetical protein
MVLAVPLLLSCQPVRGECWVRYLGRGEGGGASIAVELEIPAYETVSGADVLLDWSGLDQDLHCAAMDPATEIGSVGLVRYPEQSESEIALDLAMNFASQSEIDGYVVCDATTTTRCWLSEFSFFDTPLDLAEEYTEGQGQYLLMFQSSREDDAGVPRSLAFLRPRTSSTVTEVTFAPTCPMATVEVDLSGATGSEATEELGDAVPCEPSGVPSWTLDWSEVSTTVQGEPFDARGVDGLVLSRYDLSLGELEAAFAARDGLASHLYTVTVGGRTSADLSEATDVDGLPFAGFADGGLWVVELRSGYDVVGVPLYLEILRDP